MHKRYVTLLSLSHEKADSMADTHEGKPPKSADAIRSKLELLKNSSSSEQLEKGPAGEGFKANDQLSIGSYYNPSLARELQRRLRDAGIYSDSKTHRRQTLITVDHSDSQKGVAIAEDLRRRFPIPFRSIRIDVLTD